MNNDVLDALTLWEFPPEDFSRWRREFSDAVDSYEEYQRWLSDRERLAERMGAMRGAGAVDDRRNARGTRSAWGLETRPRIGRPSSAWSRRGDG